MPLAKLEYQKVIPGKRIGRYIDESSQDDLWDIPEETEVEIRNARLLDGLSWTTAGFELLHAPSTMKNFRDDDEVQKVYYAEVEQLLKDTLEKAGSKVEQVMVFDHTIRSSTASNLNTLGAKASMAGPVTRVHVDYNEVSAPKRLQQLAERPGYTGVQLRADAEKVLGSGQRFAFINVWCSIEMVYPDRIGSRFALPKKNSSAHKWFYYPEMKMEECLMFSCFDSRQDGPRFVFHCAFDDQTASSDIPRRSIEVRAIVIFNEYLMVR
ncbi:unnamed protein product [Cladocopium goreaui]|uniref:Methyltransferase n=1 Tax=Cladocopium goreaui TaxID=2562237 RepID=A0A9P1CLT0_9DINO|nr:unnamed protein product [Cladocopium goreaui]